MANVKHGLAEGIGYGQQGLGYVAGKTNRPGTAQTGVTTPTPGGLGQNTATNYTSSGQGQYSGQQQVGTQGGYNTGVGSGYQGQSTGQYNGQQGSVVPGAGQGKTWSVTPWTLYL